MVKKAPQTSVSEDEVDGAILNVNGKRPADSLNGETAKKVRTKSLYRQPTVRELNRLNETETLFNSNLFRLQVEEILEEVKVKEKTEKKFTEWFVSLKKHLESITSQEKEYDLSENKLYKDLMVKNPLGKEVKKTKCMFQFHKFKEVEIVGSYALGCPIKSKLVVDCEVTVPAETFTKNDSINYRYHKKRAAYLACIASHLKNYSEIKDLTYTWLDGCKTKPVLDIKPTEKLGTYLSVRLHLACEAEAYKFARFSPLRNNLREAWLFDLEMQENGEVGPPTPYYNSTVLQDLTASNNHEFLKSVLSDSDNLKQAIVLLKIWLRQRQLKVSGYVVSLFVAHLVQTKRINNFMSSYQIVRNVWIALKSSEWDTKGLSIAPGASQLDDFLSYFPVVFLDRTGSYNICYNMCNGTYQALKRESGLAVEMLDNSDINSFIPLFMTPVESLAQFDHIIKFKNLQAVIDKVYEAAADREKLNYGVDKLRLITEKLHSLLVRGLGNRVHLILEQVECDFRWPVNKVLEKAKTSSDFEEKLSFGLILDPEHALNIVEKGPSANLPEAEEFRAFWGDKSELRRFQDGSITETCVWEGDSLCAKRGLTSQIVDYLLKLKYGIEDAFHIGCQLDSVLISKHFVPSDGVVGSGEEMALRSIQAFEELRRDLRSLTELPLEIASVYGTSPVLSYCAPLPAPPAPPAAPAPPCRPPAAPWRRASTCLVKDSKERVVCPPYLEPCEAVIEMSHSGKWPGDLQAFRCLKAAFHVQISERLTKQFSVPAQAYPTHIDVMKKGIVFRLRIAHSKEMILLKREDKNGVIHYNDSEEALNLYRDTQLLTRVRGALHGLYQTHPAFGPTSCLLKRWLSSHLLDEFHFPSTVAELITAYVFIRGEPFKAPIQPLTGFVRVLKLLATQDWSREVVIVDFNKEMKPEEKAEIERKFNARDVTASPALHLVTSLDGEAPGIWTKNAPTALVLKRVKALAASTLKYIEEKLESFEDNVLGAFLPPLADYSVLLHLAPRLVPSGAEQLHRAPAPARVEEVDMEYLPVVGFHPVRKYLEELRSAYGDFALFFHDSYGGDVIAVLWKPNIDEPQDFQVSTINGAKPIKVKGEKKYKFNKEAIIEDFKILGRGLVEEVTVNG